MSEIALPRTRLAWAVRLSAGFLLGVVAWSVLARPYERSLAFAAEILLRAMERPPVTRLSARAGEIRVERSDFPPSSPRPGLSAADLHFNFVILTALFALHPAPWRPDRLAKLLAASGGLWLVHVVALVFQVQSVYATRLGPWSEEHYGPAARAIWSVGFHFYLIAGRFAAPFALWWPFARDRRPAADGPPATVSRPGGKRRSSE